MYGFDRASADALRGGICSKRVGRRRPAEPQEGSARLRSQAAEFIGEFAVACPEGEPFLTVFRHRKGWKVDGIKRRSEPRTRDVAKSIGRGPGEAT